MSCDDEDFTRVPVDVLIIEQDRRREENTNQRPRIRPPAPQPAPLRKEEPEAKNNGSRRGVTVLDITNGYETV